MVMVVNQAKFMKECAPCVEIHVSKTMVVEWHQNSVQGGRVDTMRSGQARSMSSKYLRMLQN
jgi:hypothetical protein